MKKVSDGVGNLSREVGQRLLKLRTAAGLTVRDVEDRTGVNRSVVSACERGDRKITLPHLDAMAACFGVAPALLLPTADGLDAVIKEVGDPLKRHIMQAYELGDLETLLQAVGLVAQAWMDEAVEKARVASV